MREGDGERGPRDTRLQALRENLEWLEEHDLDAETVEAAKRLGIMKGDIQAIIRSMGGNDEK